jgi:hypothetical protein
MGATSDVIVTVISFPVRKTLTSGVIITYCVFDTSLTVTVFRSVTSVTDIVAFSIIDRAVTSYPQVITLTISVLISMSVDITEVTVASSMSVTSTLLVTDWVTVPVEILTIISIPEVVALTFVSRIPGSVVNTVITVTGVWPVARPTFRITWSLVV